MTLERYDPPANSPALINPTTDSWTVVLADVIALATNIANTDFVPKDMRGSVPKVVAAILHSRELGLPPMTGLAASYVINGRVGVSAEAMRALIDQAGHSIRITEMTAARCVMKGRRSTWDQGEWTTVSYTMQEAVTAGDANKNPNYRTRPSDMLLARCTTRLARMLFADVIHGMRSVEELQDMTADSDGVLLPLEQSSAKVSRQSATPAPAVEDGTPAALGGAAPTAMGGVPAPGEAASEQRPAASPGRKRAPLTPRGRATQPSPEPAPEPTLDAEPDEDGVYDVAIVEPGEQPNVTPLAAAKAEIRAKNIVTVQMQYERILGKPVSRDERIMFTRLLVGRDDVDSTNDLTSDDLRELLKKLERTRDRDQLETYVGSLTEGGE
ncbi:MAG: hypothetical protein IPJ61_21540 [Tessaracoccus sp.]|uniref:hypothetical protein n=1 Tax=Tessaracoccus sp. TaxID=1971211 RepID=UPI001EB0C53F|nr:hypothetical protein [Tessaracoccus sp.]MBK7823573.1 hypothetical protein [Tessaracoccus sp.]